MAIGIGFVGLLIVLQPGAGVFSIAAALPFISAMLFAVYGLLNRYVASTDGTNTSFFGLELFVLRLPLLWEFVCGKT